MTGRQGKQRHIVQSIIFPSRRPITPPSGAPSKPPDLDLRTTVNGMGLRNPLIISPALPEALPIASCDSPTSTAVCSSG